MEENSHDKKFCLVVNVRLPIIIQPLNFQLI